MPPTTAEFLNALAPTWQAAVAAALLQGSLALAVVVLLWLALRKYLGNALAHGLFFLVPVKTVAAALFVAWPVVISFSITVPETVYSAIYPPQPAPTGAISELNPPAVAIEAALQPSQEQWQALPPDFANPGPETAFSEPFTTNHKTVVVTEAAKPPLGTAAWVMIAWAVACLVLIAFVCVRHMRLIRRMVRDAVPPGADYQDKLNRLAAELRLARVPQLVESPAIATPAVVGLVRPRLVVPPGFFSTFDADQQRWILLHELAHIRRHDLWWLAFERLTGIAFFFHPALWISSRATRHFRELACDDLAQMQSGLSPRQCAETFLKLIMWTSRNPARPHPITPTLSLTDRYPAIQRRIMNMTDLNPQSRWTRPSKASFAMLTATAILISLPFSPKLVAQSSKQENKNEAPPQSESVKLKGNIPEVKPKSPLISGTVVDETGKPLEGVKVVLSLRVKDLSVRAKQRVVRIDTGMTTDMNGKWSKADLPADIMDLMVQVDHPTLVTRNKSGNYHLPPFPNLTNGQDRLELVKGLKVTLRVQDEAGRPVANADVYDPTTTSIRTEMQPIGQTDANGIFERHNASKSTWVYVIKKPGFAPAVQIVDNDEGKSPAEIKFVMKPGRTIKGRLVDDSGAAVANHELAIYDRSQPIFFVYNLHAVTDANGYFECHDIPKNGAIELYRGGGDYEQLAHRIGENVVDVGTIAINALSHAVVKLVDAATGQPIPSAWLNFQYGINGAKSWVTSYPNKRESPSGEYHAYWKQLSDQTNYLVAVADGYEPFVKGPFPATGKRYDFTFQMKKRDERTLLEYSGRLLQPDGKPAEDAKIYAVSNEPGVVLGEGRLVWGGYLGEETKKASGQDGRFTVLEEQKPRQVLVTHETGYLFLDHREGIEPGTNIQWQLKPWSRVKGRVTKDGKPLAGYSIANETDQFKRVRPFQNEYSFTTTNSDGSFELNRLIPNGSDIVVSEFMQVFGRTPIRSEYVNFKPGEVGEVQIELSNPANRPPGNELKRVTARQNPDNPPDIKSEKPKSSFKTMKIGGFVVDSNDKPIEGVTARVYVRYPKGDGTRQSEQMKLESRPTDAQGKWSIDGVPENASFMHLLLKHPRKIYGDKFEEPITRPFTELRGGNLKLRMDDGFKLTIRVRDQWKKPVEGAAVYDDRVYWLENSSNKPIPLGYTNAQGELTSENQLPGTHRFIVTKQGFGPGLIAVEMSDSMPVQNVELRMGRPISGLFVDQNRKPIANAEVELSAFRDWGQVPNYGVKTDARGRFEMKDLPWEPVELMFRHKFMQVEKPVNRHDMDLGTVQFGPVNEIKYHVTDAASGKPVTTISKYLFRSDENSKSTFSSIGLEQNHQGDFEYLIYPAIARKYTFLVLAEGYQPWLSSPIEFDETHTRTDLKVALKRHEKHITYNGTALRPDGKPAAGLTVRFTPMNPGVMVGQNHFTWQLPNTKEILTDANGGFEFQSPGQIQELLILDDETYFYSSKITEWNGESRTFTLKPKPMITGRVTENGKPVARARIDIAKTGPDIYIPLWNNLQQTAYTDSQGRYKLQCIYPGPVQASVSKSASRSLGTSYGTSRELKPDADNVFNFELSDYKRD